MRELKITRTKDVNARDDAMQGGGSIGQTKNRNGHNRKRSEEMTIVTAKHRYLTVKCAAVDSFFFLPASRCPGTTPTGCGQRRDFEKADGDGGDGVGGGEPVALGVHVVSLYWSC